MRYNLVTGSRSVLAAAESPVWLAFTKIRVYRCTREGYAARRDNVEYNDAGFGYVPAWQVLASRNGKTAVIASVETAKGREGEQMDYVRRVLVDREKRGCYRGGADTWPKPIKMST